MSGVTSLYQGTFDLPIEGQETVSMSGTFPYCQMSYDCKTWYELSYHVKYTNIGLKKAFNKYGTENVP